MPGAKQIKVGNVILHEGGLFRVLSSQIIAPGNWRSFVQMKLRNIVSGGQTEVRFRSEDNIERAILDNKHVEFLYKDGDHYHFMDTDSYEQFHLLEEMLGDAIKFLTPNLKMEVQFHETKPVGLELPQTVTLKVVETSPFIKTATVTNSFKAAKMETGYTFQVPGFITEGDSVDIDTATGDYVGRAKQ